MDECSVRPSLCHNGATCTNSPGSYSCICVNGWTGPDCSVNIDDCAGAACFNGATCIDRVGSFYCQCTYGKTGESNDSLTRDFLEYCRPILRKGRSGGNFMEIGTQEQKFNWTFLKLVRVETRFFQMKLYLVAVYDIA